MSRFPKVCLFDTESLRLIALEKSAITHHESKSKRERSRTRRRYDLNNLPR